MNKIAFGIDLGTSTSEISCILNGKPVAINDIHPRNRTPIVPSVVALGRNGSDLLVGVEAVDEGLPEHKIREAKRHIGEERRFKIGNYQLLPEEVGALVLKKMASLGEAATGQPVVEAVITVPAYFSDLPRRATEKAALLAGLRPLRLISEPVAAALAYGITRLDDENMLLVVDFGGGTLDVTVIEMMAGVLDVRATDGDRQLGGKDVDDLLMRHICQRTGFQMPEEQTSSYEALKKAAESAKKELSRQAMTTLYVANFDGVSDLNFTVSREMFDTLIDPLIDRAIEKVEACLEKAGVNKQQIQKLLLVGGTCYIPRVQSRIEAYLGLAAESGVDRDLAVSLGAAISAGLKTGSVDRNSVVVQDVSTYRLGIDCVELVGDREMLVFDELMPAGAGIPFFRSNRYSLRRLDQDEAVFSVYQAEGNGPLLAQDAISTGATGVIGDIPPSTTGEPRSVDVELRYDESHIIRVSAKIVGTDRECTVQLNTAQFSNDALSMLGASSAVETLWQQSPLADRNSKLINRAESVLSTVPERAEHIEAALEQLKLAIASNDVERTQDARDRLTDILADL